MKKEKMKTVDIEVNGRKYRYEDIPYWDKEKKQGRHKRNYIGRIEDGTNKVIASKNKIHNIKSRGYGAFHLLSAISEKTDLTEILKTKFSNRWEDILTLAFYELVERQPMYLCEQWSDDNITFSNKIMYSSRISELLSSITEQDKFSFFNSWTEKRIENEYVALDITSVSSYSQQLEQIEYGYNRDNEKLPQLNIAMLFGNSSELPILYNTHMGSVKDVKTLINILTLTEYANLNKLRLIMDRGFYSKKNITQMIREKIKFIIGIPFTLKYAKEQVVKNLETITNAQNYIKVNKDIYFCTTEKVLFEGKKLTAHIFFNEQKYVDEKNIFLNELIKAEDEIKSKTKDTINSELKKYFTIKGKKRITISRNEEAIQDKIKYMGFFSLLSNTKETSQRILEIYRRKELVENSFDDIKNELDMERLRIHNDATLHGKLFVIYISLILKSHINKIMRENNLYRNYTIIELLKEVNKIKKVELNEKKCYLTDITSKHQKIYSAFGIEPPNI